MKMPRSLPTALLLAPLTAILCSPATAQNVTERFRALDKNSDEARENLRRLLKLPRVRIIGEDPGFLDDYTLTTAGGSR